MAKEAEKADLLKRRQKLRERLVSREGAGGLTAAELERVRYYSLTQTHGKKGMWRLRCVCAIYC